MALQPTCAIRQNAISDAGVPKNTRCYVTPNLKSDQTIVNFFPNNDKKEKKQTNKQKTNIGGLSVPAKFLLSGRNTMIIIIKKIIQKC